MICRMIVKQLSATHVSVAHIKEYSKNIFDEDRLHMTLIEQFRSLATVIYFKHYPVIKLASLSACSFDCQHNTVITLKASFF